MVSKFMALGMDLDKVIERVTVKPAGVFDYGLPLGTLKSGSEADISILRFTRETSNLSTVVEELGEQLESVWTPEVGEQGYFLPRQVVCNEA